MLNTISRAMTFEGWALSGWGGFTLAFILVCIGHTVFFNVEAPFLKMASVQEAFLRNFTVGVMLPRLIFAPIIWASLNYIARFGGVWFSMLLLTLIGRGIQIMTFGLRFGQWPENRDWAGIALVFIAVLVTLKIPK